MRWLSLVLVLAACTPADVHDWWSQVAPDQDPLPDAAVQWVVNGAAEKAADPLPNYNGDPAVEQIIVDSANKWGIDVDRWARIAWCESSFNPAAKNPRSSASGLFQHLAIYWPDRAAAAGHPGGDIFDAWTNADVSGWLATTGGFGHWVCK